MNDKKVGTFTGEDKSNTTTTFTYPNVEFDRIKYCPFCGKDLQLGVEELRFCPFCGKEVPRTTTRGIIVYRWNYPDGTPSYHTQDGIINPIVTC